MTPQPFSLTGRTVLVTGASAGLGRATAISASDAGARVIITGRNAANLAETYALLATGAAHHSISADLAQPEDRERLVAELPALDGLVHSAGVAQLHPFKFSDVARYRDSYSINVEAPFFLTQSLLKARKINRAASIVFISSISPIVGSKGHAIYAGTKSALQGISRVLAHELAAQRIRSNCLSPAMIKTAMNDRLADHISPELRDADEARYPLGYGEPEDVANTVVFYLAPASKWITGTNLIMDGGLT
jgi:NAD(P)-dependent dehydrogenase (short-subunit alcohol dehydrogenase family)